jgi:hypothetical protein
LKFSFFGPPFFFKDGYSYIKTYAFFKRDSKKFWNLKFSLFGPPFFFKDGYSYIKTYAFFKRDSPIRNLSLNKPHQNQMKKKALDVQLKKKNPFLFLRASCLEMGRITIAQTNINLYSVLMIIVLKIQKDSSTTT